MSLLLDLIQSGIRVVQLLPVETVYDAKSNPMHLMMAIMELSRGHSESAMKSERVGRAWQDKKRRAAENGEPLTARVPSWLRLVDGEWEVDEQAADADPAHLPHGDRRLRPGRHHEAAQCRGACRSSARPSTGGGATSPSC